MGFIEIFVIILLIIFIIIGICYQIEKQNTLNNKVKNLEDKVVVNNKNWVISEREGDTYVKNKHTGRVDKVSPKPSNDGYSGSNYTPTSHTEIHSYGYPIFLDTGSDNEGHGHKGHTHNESSYHDYPHHSSYHHSSDDSSSSHSSSSCSSSSDFSSSSDSSSSSSSCGSSCGSGSSCGGGGCGS